MTSDDRFDDRFDDRLRRAAGDYHAPPARVPRDEMWQRIAAARTAARRSTSEDAGQHTTIAPAPDGVVVMPTRRWHSAAWARALAAALLLAAGIGVGRWSATRSSSSSSADTARTVATQVTPDEPHATASEASTPGMPDTPATRLASSSGSHPSAPIAIARPRIERVAESSTESSTERGAESSTERGAESREPRAESPLPYRLAAAEHLALTEALLTTVSADVRAGRGADSSVALWARDLLGTTRLLLDSPAARDPKLARLLQDLELVLAEVAQLRPARGSEELQSIDRAVRQRGVLTRLRATLPAGPISAGT